MEWNCRLPKAARSSQVLTDSDDTSTSFPCNFGVVNMDDDTSGTVVRGKKYRMEMSSRFVNREMKRYSCREVEIGPTSVSDRNVFDRCPKCRGSTEMNAVISNQ